MWGSANSGVRWALGLCVLFASCAAGGNATTTGTGAAPAATPIISTAAAQNGAVVITLSTTTSNATVYYTTDESTPTTSSPVYRAPFLVASDLTVKAIAEVSGGAASAVASERFAPHIPSGTLVWSDEFGNSSSANAQPNPAVWNYDTGASGWGNGEREDYCGWSSSASPCSTANPNAYVGSDGYLHIVAEEPAAGMYTSARLKTEGLFSFQYGRIEFRAKVPEAQGLWPAAWLLGNSEATGGWPACGEMDVLERVNAAPTPDWNEGSIHGTGFIGGNLGTRFAFPSGESASDWHTYGMIWSKGSVAYYVDDPTRPYVTYTPSSVAGLTGSVWPFDSGANYIILNLAVGGSWPGNPNARTPFPSQMLVDYVRIYTN